MKTALYNLHKELGATFTNFMGYEMPLKYTSIQEEHLNVRNKVGIFDVSHMGNIFIKGDAEKFISKITVENASKIKSGMGQYTLILDYDGNIIDDEVFLHIGDEYLFIPNAGMHEKIHKWMEKNLEGNIEIKDVSDEYSILAIQGPLSMEALQEILRIDLAKLKLFECCELKKEDFKIEFDGRCILSRTGYTGERGYELYIYPKENAINIFEELLERGKKYGIMPIGIGARDTLRLEKCFMLACNEFKGGRNPIEAGLEWTIDWNHDFIGKEALIEFKKKENYEKLVFLKCLEAGIPRQDDEVIKNGEKIGNVTSGNFSPCLKTGIAMAYVNNKYAKEGEELYIKGRKMIKAIIVKPPFVKRGEC